jgi:hypothetical protein
MERERPTYFTDQLREQNHIKIFCIECKDLPEVDILHGAARGTAPASGIRDYNLVHEDGVAVHADRRQLLDQALGLVDRQEFGDADADKRGVGLQESKK